MTAMPDPMRPGGLFCAVRPVLVGRRHEPRELVFDRLAPEPVLEGVVLGLLGPVSAAALHTLTLEAEQCARRLGYFADTFAILGVGPTQLVALVPGAPIRHPCEAAEALRRLGLEPPPRWDLLAGSER